MSVWRTVFAMIFLLVKTVFNLLFWGFIILATCCKSSK